MEIMDLSTKRIITVTVEYDFSDDPELAATLTDKNIVEKMVMDQISDAFIDNEGFESIEVVCEDV